MNPSKILLLGCVYPKDTKDKVSSKAVGGLDIAADEFQWNLVEGIEYNFGFPVDIVNMLPVYSFPRRYKDWRIKQSNFEHCKGAKDINVGFINIMLIKQVFKDIGIIPVVNKWLKNNSTEQKVIISYTLDYGFLRCFKKAKKYSSGIKTCAVVADLPAYSNLSKKQSMLMRMFSKWKSNKVYNLLKYVDCFVLLTEQMTEPLNITDKSFCVVEGIAKKNTAEERIENDGIITIVYTGTLHKRFGVLNLVDAFCMINDKNYSLVICGAGDSEDEIKAAAEKDSRIIYKGAVSHEEVLNIQRNANILVNPRQNNEEYTKYSFPSKTMEYLAAGRPVVAYKLYGIPEEYSEYISYVKDDSTEALRDKMVEIGSLSREEQNILGEKGRQFVLNAKNSISQTKKIKDMIEKLV